VRHVRRILSFEIEEETKNEGSVRVVPVHSNLIALGIEQHITNLREAGKDRLFPNWYAEGVRKKESSKRSINQPFASILPRWFNRTYLPGVGIHDSTKVFHSFRHTLKSALARAGVSRHISDEITGHDDSSSGAGYIHDAPVEAMKEALESVIFDGFDPAKIKK
jgi:integrase